MVSDYIVVNHLDTEGIEREIFLEAYEKIVLYFMVIIKILLFPLKYRLFETKIYIRVAKIGS